MNSQSIIVTSILFYDDKCRRPQNLITSHDDDIRQNVYHELTCSQISEQIFETK